MHRRTFHAALATLAAASGLSNSLAANAGKSAQNEEECSGSNRWPIAIFEKPFEGLSYDKLAEAIAQTGAAGIEATIRPGGHIEPNQAAEEIPKMIAALEQRDLRIIIAATHIESANSESETFLRTLVAQGISHYRLKHFRFDLNKSIPAQLDRFTKKAEEIAAMNAEVGIQGLYQTHSGSSRDRGYVGVLGIDAAIMLRDVDPNALGLAFDTRHVQKDTGSSIHLAIAAMKPHIRSIYVKDGLWTGERSNEYRDVPLDTGFVTEGVFEEARSGISSMPLSIHMEWLGYRVFPDSEIQDAVDACRRDVKTLQGWLATTG